MLDVMILEFSWQRQRHSVRNGTGILVSWLAAVTQPARWAQLETGRLPSTLEKQRSSLH
jgi:hypothetical protein